MNYIDMFIIVLIIWAIFKGYTRGLIMQLTSFLGLVLGIFLSLKLSGVTVNILESHLNVSREALYIISLAMTFTLVFIGVNLLGRVIENIVKTTDLSNLNRFFGVIFSLFKTILIIGILLILIDRIDQRINLLPKYSKEHSFFYKPFTSIVSKIFPSINAYQIDYNEPPEIV